MSTVEHLSSVIRDTFALTDNTDIAPLLYGDFAAWDSVGHMALMAAVESTFDVTFATDEVPTLTSVDKILAALEKHGVGA